MAPRKGFPGLLQIRIYTLTITGFVAETAGRIYMLEPKARNQMENAEVLAKRDAAVLWCKRASDHAATYGGKSWEYLLIPHDAIAENMTLQGLAERFSVC